MRLLWRIYLAFFVTTILALSATAWYANYSLSEFYEAQVRSDLLTRANLMASELAPIPLEDIVAIDGHCKKFGQMTQTRVTVIRPDGVVLGDSDHDPALMENHRRRPEISDAFLGSVGESKRFSDTLRRSLLYLAIPMRKDGEIVAVVRAAMPLAVIDWNIRSVHRHVVFGGCIVAICFAVIAFLLARQISRPLYAMKQTAERLAKGDLRARVPLPRDSEMAALAQAMNQMAGQLDERMDTILRQGNEHRAIFSSMVEGVLTVDEEGRILDLNASAVRILDVSSDTVRGQSIQEAVRNPDLQAFLTATLAADGPMETELVLYGLEERFLQVHGTALTDSAGKKLGALVVMHDITRIKRLETVRRDFVANVSHELKTPITALRGCVETLSDPTQRNPEDDERFLSMMTRQVDRLHAIVEDLLSLARVEHDAEHKRIPLESASVSDVLNKTVQSLTRSAQDKRITLTVNCPPDLTALLNAPLLEQAVGNLVDNAIKYSAEGTHVVLIGRQKDRDVEIRVIDQGPGIEKKHVNRIFERFYRVDQARSRTLGGTGLGLAIVKHIVLAHGGFVTVESIPGQGSTFLIRIPHG